jgi:hypothetical protein|tara:strand:+ start:1829 stop:2035 length:207 start_codon:yes stop_codon:yes gene_type:complete
MFCEEPFASSPLCSVIYVQAGFAEKHYFTLYVQQVASFSGSINKNLVQDLSIQQEQQKIVQLLKKAKS